MVFKVLIFIVKCVFSCFGSPSYGGANKKKDLVSDSLFIYQSPPRKNSSVRQNCLEQFYMSVANPKGEPHGGGEYKTQRVLDGRQAAPQG